jgi:hypothetical protein
MESFFYRQDCYSVVSARLLLSCFDQIVTHLYSVSLLPCCIWQDGYSVVPAKTGS